MNNLKLIIAFIIITSYSIVRASSNGENPLDNMKEHTLHLISLLTETNKKLIEYTDKVTEPIITMANYKTRCRSYSSDEDANKSETRFRSSSPDEDTNKLDEAIAHIYEGRRTLFTTIIKSNQEIILAQNKIQAFRDDFQG